MTMFATIQRYVASPAFGEALRKAARTFGYAFLAILVPGLLGWLHAVTDWAQAQGQAPFPDATSLVYLAVSAIVAGAIGLVNLIGILVEDAIGHAPLRTPAPQRTTGRHTANDRGHVSGSLIAAIVVAGLILWLLIQVLELLFRG